MTLEEAIKHCEDIATEKDAMVELYKAFEMDANTIKRSIADCQDCAEEHRQLVEWLEELRYYRKRNAEEYVYSYRKGTAACPTCGRIFLEGDASWKARYCFHCGQRLHWLTVEKWEAKPTEPKNAEK